MSALLPATEAAVPCLHQAQKETFQKKDTVTMPEILYEQMISIGPNQLGIHAAPELLNQLCQALRQPGSIQVDLQGARRVHTAVLQVLVAAAIACSECSRAFAVCGLSPQLSSFLDVAGLSRALSVPEQDGTQVTW
jgi:anti-anti-sigma regulatory factor